MTTSFLDLDCYNITKGPAIPLGVSVDGPKWHGSSTQNDSNFFIAIDGFISFNSTLETSYSISDYINATNGT
ncbi:hypothetical protein G7Y89_g7680 [Cudoniella acicularis]|uniref:Uncharacterized protein n=1 Tax=Cudoniella acicularis TaxID=354080 RepID=A0A8H4RJM6_9HELO|nr:hypothetical protein G7Y89_g7680 [Cudoniella acicularis]